jgi:hypothetical protein
VAVGAEDPIGDRLFVGVVLFVVDESMGDQLATAYAMLKGKLLLVSIPFQGEAKKGRVSRSECYFFRNKGRSCVLNKSI